jgi:hypothetical protein
MEADMRRQQHERPDRLRYLSTAVALAAMVAAGLLYARCGSMPPRHRAVMASGTIAEAIGGLQDSIDGLHLAGGLSADQYAPVNDNVLKLLEEGRTYNTLVAQWPVGTPVPQAVLDSSAQITKLLTSTINLIPLTHRDVVTARALAIEQAAITVIALRE